MVADSKQVRKVEPVQLGAGLFPTNGGKWSDYVMTLLEVHGGLHLLESDFCKPSQEAPDDDLVAQLRKLKAREAESSSSCYSSSSSSSSSLSSPAGEEAKEGLVVKLEQPIAGGGGGHLGSLGLFPGSDQREGRGDRTA